MSLWATRPFMCLGCEQPRACILKQMAKKILEQGSSPARGRSEKPLILRAFMMEKRGENFFSLPLLTSFPRLGYNIRVNSFKENQMKTKHILGLLACAAASAVAMNAYANTTTNWFGASATDSTLNLTAATTNGAAVTVANSTITIDNDYSTLLSVAPSTATPALNDGLVTITSTAVLTPCAYTDLPDSSTISDAKVGFAVAYNGTATNYYCYAIGGGWGATSASVSDPSAATTFTITIDYRTKVASFAVGENVVSNNVSFTTDDTALTDVAAFGTGSISSIDAKYEVAVAQYGSVKYGSYAEAITAAGENKSSIQVVSSSGEVQDAGTAANGLQKWECAALNIEETAQVALQPATKQHSGVITLATSGITADDGITVKYTVNGSGSYDADDIQIPMEAGTYTIAPVITAE